MRKQKKVFLAKILSSTQVKYNNAYTYGNAGCKNKPNPGNSQMRN